MLRSSRKSKTIFFNNNENSLVVLPDQATVIGVSNNNGRKSLVMENLKARDSSIRFVEFGSHDKQVQSLLLLSNAYTLLAADEAGQVIQYCRGSRSGAWTRQKHYGNLGVGSLCSSASFGHLAVFGGNNGLVRFVDTKSKEIFGMPCMVAAKEVQSLELFSNGKAEAFLAVGGDLEDYSAEATNIFRVSRLAEALKIDTDTQNQSQTIKVSRGYLRDREKKCKCDVNGIPASLVKEIKEYIHKHVEQMLGLLQNQLDRKGRKNI